MIGDTNMISYEIGHVGDDTTNYPAPQQVQWLKDGLPVVHTPTNMATPEGRLTTTLSFTVAATDDGVYQCFITSTTAPNSEVFVTVATRLDTSK